MMRMLDGNVASWASILDDKAREQAIETATLPFINPHLALMPDAHYGKGSTIGSVIPTQGVVIPAAVGVDIGCGMSAVRTQLRRQDVEETGNLPVLRAAIEREIPVSMGKYRSELSEDATYRVELLEYKARRTDVDPDSFSPTWRKQLGTLGGGNHFIELCYDEEDRVWVFLHSGSRGIGNKIAQHHVNVAKESCCDEPIPNPDLAYLIEGEPEFDAYIRDLDWAQGFAASNRAEMVDRVIECMDEWYGEQIITDQIITCHHNYTTRETHFGSDVWLTRKGAINAERGRMGLIPGSMGERSYVVSGLGNPMAFNSAPHGAGRMYSRNAARKRFSTDELAEAMAGIEWRADAADKLLDEIPSAYKDIDIVMQDAADLVQIEHTLRQFLNIKGD